MTGLRKDVDEANESENRVQRDAGVDAEPDSPVESEDPEEEEAEGYLESDHGYEVTGVAAILMLLKVSLRHLHRLMMN